MIYLFNHQEKLIKIIKSNAIRSFYQTQELTSEKYVSDKVEIEIKALPESILKQIEYVAVPDHFEPFKYHLFFVVKETTEGNITELIGVQSGIEELRKSPIFDQRPENRPVRLIAEGLVANTNWQIGYAPDKVVKFINFYYIDAFEALKKMCEVANVEIQFHVEINGNKIGNRYIEIKNRIGKNEGRRVVYGHNALEIVKEVEKTELYTALIGRGNGEHVSTSEDGRDNYGRKITFEEIEWEKSKGAPLDKPKGQIYLEDKEMTAIYGIETPEGKRPKMGFVEFDTDDKEEVLRRTYEALRSASRPQIEMKTSSLYLKNTGIGDTVRVIRHDRGLEYSTRVFKVKINRLSGRYEIKLGDQLSTDSSGRSANKKIVAIESQLNQGLSEVLKVMPSADGFKQLYFSEEEPTNPRLDSTWFQPDPEHEGHYIMKQWNGEMWQEVLRTYDNAKFEKHLEDLNHRVSEIDATIAESDRKAQEALEKAGVSTDLAKEVRKEVLVSQKEIQETQVSLIQYAKELQSLGEVSNETQTEVSGLQQTLEGLNSTVTHTLMDPQTGLIRQIQSQQEQTAEVLKSKLSVSEVDGLIEGKNLLSVSQYTHEKEETAKGVARQLSAIRGGVLSVFGIRNYILASDDFVTSGRKTFKVSDEFIRLAKPGTQFVFSAEVSGSDLVARGRSRYGGQVVIRYTDGTTQWAGAWQLGTEGTETKRISEVYTIPAGKTIESVEALIDVEIGGDVRVANPMLEISSVPNEWQLALEDGDQQLTTAKLAEYKQTVDSQLAKLSSTVEDPKTGLMKRLENYQTQTAEALQSKLTSTEVESLIDGKGLLSVERYTHDRTETAQIFERTLTELKDTIPSEVGARNYVRGSAEMKKGNGNWDTGTFRHSGPGTSETVEINDFPNQNITKAIKLTRGEEGETGIAQDHFTMSEGDWTLSWWVKAPIGSEIRIQAYWSNDNRSTGVSTPFTSETDEWQRLRFTATNETAGRVSIAYIYLVTGSEMLVTAPKLEKGNILTDWSPAPEDYQSELTSKLTQMADSIDLALFNTKGAVSRIHLNQEGIRLKGKLLHVDAQTYIEKGIIKAAHIGTAEIKAAHIADASIANAKIINLDFNKLVGNKTAFLQSIWQATNSMSYIDGTKIQVRASDGSYVEMNNVPEFRSSDPGGTATVMGNGRTHYLDKDGVSLGYIGMNLYSFDYNGSRVPTGSKYGVWLSRGSGGFSINYMQDGGYVQGSENVYYTTKAGETYPVAVIEAVMRYKRNADNWGNFEWVKNELARLNGYGAWPWNATFRAGDRVIIEKGTVGKYIPAGYQRFLDCTNSSNGTPTIYTYTEMRMQQSVIMEKNLWVKGQARVGSLRNDSDRKLKQNIQRVSSSALKELMALNVVAFDWKETGIHQDYGLIAQESGKFRIQDETEGVDLIRLLYASVKAIQELNERIDKLETRCADGDGE